MKVIHNIIPALFIFLCFVSCKKVKPLGSEYFLDGKEIVYRYESSGPGVPKLPWDNKYKIVNADKDTFVPLQWPGYAKDKHHFFYRGDVIRNIDYATFEITDDVKTDYGSIAIVKDQYHVYKFREPWSIIEGADPKTYRIAENLKGNGNWFWYKDNRNYFVGDTIISVDYDTFKSIDEDSRFYIDKDNIYWLKSAYKNTFLEKIPAPGLINSQIVYSNRVLQTPNALYYVTKKEAFTKIPIEDLSSLKFFPPANIYMMVDRQIYCEGELLSGVDFDTFSVYQYPGNSGYTAYAKDKNNVYYRNEILEGADPTSVRLADRYMEDDTYKWTPDLSSTSVIIRKTAKETTTR